MPDTPTPAPALTAEQIDADLDDLRDLVANFGPCDRKNKRADLFDRTIAAADDLAELRAENERLRAVAEAADSYTKAESDPGVLEVHRAKAYKRLCIALDAWRAGGGE